MCGDVQVTAEDGVTYDRRYIQQWFDERKRNGKTIISPIVAGKNKKKDGGGKFRIETGTELKPNDALREQISKFVDENTKPADSASAHSGKTVSMHVLNKIFDVLDELDDVLRALLSDWEPPEVVVIGRQSAGKSTILERLCMIPVFPHGKNQCTIVAIRVNIRRSPIQLPGTRFSICLYR